MLGLLAAFRGYLFKLNNMNLPALYNTVLVYLSVFIQAKR